MTPPPDAARRTASHHAWIGPSGRLMKEGAKVGIVRHTIAQRMSANAIDTDDRSNVATRITLRVDNGDGVRMRHDGIPRAGVDLVRQFPPGVALYESPGQPLQRVRFYRTTYDLYLTRVASGLAATTPAQTILGTVVSLAKDTQRFDGTTILVDDLNPGADSLGADGSARELGGAA